jgi:hypothetical protein
MRSAWFLITICSSAVLQAQSSAPRVLFELGVGPGVSTRPPWAYRHSGTLGVGAVARVTSSFRFGRIGAEWLAWIGRGEEYSAGGFPPPNRPPPSPTIRSVLLTRSALSMIARVGGSGQGNVKVGIGVARVQAIERLEVIDAEVRRRQSRLAPVATFGVSAPRRVATRFDLSPGLDLVVPLNGGGAAVLLASLAGRWASRDP